MNWVSANVYFLRIGQILLHYEENQNQTAESNYKLIKAVTKDVHALLAKGLTPFPGSFHATCSDCIF